MSSENRITKITGTFNNFSSDKLKSKVKQPKTNEPENLFKQQLENEKAKDKKPINPGEVATTMALGEEGGDGRFDLKM